MEPCTGSSLGTAVVGLHAISGTSACIDSRHFRPCVRVCSSPGKGEVLSIALLTLVLRSNFDSGPFVFVFAGLHQLEFKPLQKIIVKSSGSL
jgi:hypothetical protein